MRRSIIQYKSYILALNLSRLMISIQGHHKEFVLSKQLLRSACSIGANVEEAWGCQSIKDFKSKMHIAYKEARESKYWLRLITDLKFINKEESSDYLSQLDEICKILWSIINTSNKR